MASRQLATTQAEHNARLADIARASELRQRYPDFAIWSSRHGEKRIATRSADQQPPAKGTVWARTLIADDWDDLERQLAEQAQHDAELTYRAAS